MLKAQKPCWKQQRPKEHAVEQKYSYLSSPYRCRDNSTALTRDNVMHNSQGCQAETEQGAIQPAKAAICASVGFWRDVEGVEPLQDLPWLLPPSACGAEKWIFRHTIVLYDTQHTPCREGVLPEGPASGGAC